MQLLLSVLLQLKGVKLIWGGLRALAMYCFWPNVEKQEFKALGD